jgi:hypothetical protein
MNSSTTASVLDAVATARKVTSMKALKPLAAACAASVALLAVSTPAEAQAPPRGGGGSSFRGPPPGSYHGGRAPHGYRPAHSPPRTTFYFGYYGPGYWWGPGYWPGYSWGPGYWGPRYGYAYPPYGYYPPAYAAPDPPVYIERDAPAAPPEQVWWYWCASANAYYPYVKECPGGWQRVAPQTAPPAGKQ